MKRPLPTEAEAAEILSRRKTRPVRRAPLPAGKRLNRLVKSLDAKYGKGASGLAAHWREIAGEGLYRATEPIRLITPKAGGAATLEIRVEGPAAALIQHQAPQILARTNLFLGADAVAKLRIVQGPIRREPARPLRRKRPPLDAAQEAALSEGLAAVEDGTLKDALMRLGREVLRRGD